MKKKTFLIFGAYIWIKTFYGVTFHPYKTLWEIRRHPVLAPMLATPFSTLLSVIILGKIGSVLISVYGQERVLIAVILGGAILSILLWQLLVIYFLFNFLLVSRRST